MRKSIWIELIEWCLLLMIALFMLGVLLHHRELTTPVGADSTAPVESLDE